MPNLFLCGNENESCILTEQEELTNIGNVICSFFCLCLSIYFSD